MKCQEHTSMTVPQEKDDICNRRQITPQGNLSPLRFKLILKQKICICNHFRRHGTKKQSSTGYGRPASTSWRQVSRCRKKRRSQRMGQESEQRTAVWLRHLVPRAMIEIESPRQQRHEDTECSAMQHGTAPQQNQSPATAWTSTLAGLLRCCQEEAETLSTTLQYISDFSSLKGFKSNQNQVKSAPSCSSAAPPSSS